jgi:tetratricopeptide (TPR) repeat protein
VEEHYDALTPHQLLAFARFSEWDYTVLLGAMPLLMQFAETASPLALEELRELARNTWAGHFPLREPVDVAFQAAMLLLAAQSPREALALFEESIRWYGPDAATSTNIAVCHLALRQLPEATEHVRAALALDPEAGGAMALLEAIEKERGAGG